MGEGWCGRQGGWEQEPEEGDRLSEEDQREREDSGREGLQRKRDGEGMLERWLPTSSSDAPVTSSGKPIAITHM